jgi:hypothetical protein
MCFGKIQFVKNLSCSIHLAHYKKSSNNSTLSRKNGEIGSLIINYKFAMLGALVGTF